MTIKNNIEVILDTNPSGGCGCNCGCGGSTVVEDMTNLVEELKQYDFKKDVEVDVLPISDLQQDVLISKINDLLSKTKAVFRVTDDNLEETLSNILPLIVLDGSILTAYGVPTLSDVVVEVEKSL